MMSPHGTEYPHGTQDNPHIYHDTPHGTEHPHGTAHTLYRVGIEDSFIGSVWSQWRNVSGTFREAGVLVLDVSVRELQPRIKQKL